MTLVLFAVIFYFYFFFHGGRNLILGTYFSHNTMYFGRFLEFPVYHKHQNVLYGSNI